MQIRMLLVQFLHDICLNVLDNCLSQSADIDQLNIVLTMSKLIWRLHLDNAPKTESYHTAYVATATSANYKYAYEDTYIVLMFEC